MVGATSRALTADYARAIIMMRQQVRRCHYEQMVSPAQHRLFCLPAAGRLFAFRALMTTVFLAFTALPSLMTRGLAERALLILGHYRAMPRRPRYYAGRKLIAHIYSRICHADFAMTLPARMANARREYVAFNDYHRRRVDYFYDAARRDASTLGFTYYINAIFTPRELLHTYRSMRLTR